MSTSVAHLGLYDTLADWEVGYLLVELRTGRFTGRPWNIVTVAESREPITTMGGLRIMPDMILDAGQRSLRPPRVSWTPGFRWQPSAVPRLVSPEPAFWTAATTPARQLGT